MGSGINHLKTICQRRTRCLKNSGRWETAQY